MFSFDVLLILLTNSAFDFCYMAIIHLFNDIFLCEHDHNNLNFCNHCISIEYYCNYSYIFNKYNFCKLIVFHLLTEYIFLTHYKILFNIFKSYNFISLSIYCYYVQITHTILIKRLNYS